MSLHARLWDSAINGSATEASLDREFLRSLPTSEEGDMASEKLRKLRKARARKFASFEELLETPEFSAFLHSRDLMLLGAPGLPDADTRARLDAFEMEKAALGAMLQRQDEPISKGMNSLHARHFKRDAHAAIFMAICDLERRRKLGLEDLREVCVFGVIERLRAKGLGEKFVGVESYCLELIDGCPSAANMDFYIRRVREASKLRHLHRLGLFMASLAIQHESQGRRVAAFSRLALHRIERDAWCDFSALLSQLEK